MAKKPLITRSELRKHKSEEYPQKEYRENSQLEEPVFSEDRETIKEKNERSRVVENKKIKERSHTLNIAIIVVSILLIILFYVVFNF